MNTMRLLLSLFTAIFLFQGRLLQAEEHNHQHDQEHSDHSESEEAEVDDDHDDHEGHGDHEEEKNDRFGPGKAILAASKKQGVQLSAKATETLGITTEKLTGRGSINGVFQLPLSAVVFFQDEVGVYRLKDGWFKLIETEVVSKTKTHVTLKNKPKHVGLAVGDQFAKSGVPLLRAAELEAWGGSGDGHGH